MIGISKAYTTRVGSGPFPTEIDGADGETLRREGGEFGATTGRSRRCGWFDAVGVRHAVRMNGITGVALTKLDVLTGFKKIPICTAYRYDDKVVNDFPASLKVMQNAQAVYEEMEGWDKPLDDVRNSPTCRRRLRHMCADSRRLLKPRLFSFRSDLAENKPFCSKTPLTLRQQVSGGDSRFVHRHLAPGVFLLPQFENFQVLLYRRIEILIGLRILDDVFKSPEQPWRSGSTSLRTGILWKPLKLLLAFLRKDVVIKEPRRVGMGRLRSNHRRIHLSHCGLECNPVNRRPREVIL